METGIERERIVSVVDYGGLPLSADAVQTKVGAQA